MQHNIEVHFYIVHRSLLNAAFKDDIVNPD